MSHLPDIGLRTWKRGESLNAAELNSNFQKLLQALETVMHVALTPDAAGVANEVHIASHEQRLAALESMVQLHARQRNEREWAPLAHVAALMQLMLEIRGPLAAKADALQHAVEQTLHLHDSLILRLQRLEQAPEYATQEDHAALSADCATIAQKAQIAMVQAVSLRQEVGTLRKLALGHDRLANRMEYAPLSTVGHVLQRIREIEARLGALEP